MNTQKPHGTPKTEITCPSCKQTGLFTHAGVQPIPPRVAQKLGLHVNHVDLWHCPHCKTTISALALLAETA